MKKSHFPRQKAVCRLKPWPHFSWDSHCPFSLQGGTAPLTIKLMQNETWSSLDIAELQMQTVPHFPRGEKILSWSVPPPFSLHPASPHHVREQVSLVILTAIQIINKVRSEQVNQILPAVKARIEAWRGEAHPIPPSISCTPGEQKHQVKQAFLLPLLYLVFFQSSCNTSLTGCEVTLALFL